MVSFLKLDEDSFYGKAPNGFAATGKETGDYYVLAATGKYESYIDKTISGILEADTIAHLEETIRKKKPLFLDGRLISFFETNNGSSYIIYIQHGCQLSSLDKNLIQVFLANMSTAFDNITLNQEVVDTQKELIFTLAKW